MRRNPRCLPVMGIMRVAQILAVSHPPPLQVTVDVRLVVNRVQNWSLRYAASRAREFEIDRSAC